MNGGDLVIDGSRVRFVRSGDDSWRVIASGGEDVLVDIGSLERVSDGSGFVARRLDGRALTIASRWGGAVTARYGSRELAARALLDARRAEDS